MFTLILAVLTLGQAAAAPPQEPAKPSPKIEEIKRGEGPVVKAGDLVTVHYIATTLEGVQLADSEKRGVPMRFVIGEKGAPEYMVTAIAGMQERGERKVTLPPELAFGGKGAKPIVAPNTTLILQVKLVDISKPPSKEGGQR